MRNLVSEFLGTFILLFAGTGAIIANDVSGGQVTHVGIALTFGLVVLAMVYTFGEISGAHLNPAVTIGFWLAKRFRGRSVAPYVVTQLAGALTASLTLKLLFPAHSKLGATLPSGTIIQSFVFEFLLTFILMLVILNVSTGAKEKGITAGIVVGSVVGLEAMFAGPICGASMNPARSFAPAVASGHLQHLWLYIAAPTLGSIAAVFACRLVQEPGSCAGKESCQ
ncbi:MAG: MIP/aquaporin family protein [Verrucomicrobiales bacterium]